MSRPLLLAILDQGLMSALSLGLGLALVALATQEALGHYTLAMAVFFMAFSIKYALVTLPIATALGGAEAPEQRALLRAVGSFDLCLIAASTLVGLVVLSALGFGPHQLVAAALMLVGGLWRELARTVLIARGDMARCLALDALAAVATLALAAALWPLLAPEVAVLAALGLANLGAALWLGPRLPLSLGGLAEYPRHARMARWTLLGGIAAELQARGYVFMVQMLRGVAANGALQASRLVISPIDMVGMAWARVAMPKMAAAIRAGRPERAFGTAFAGMGLMAGIALAYGLVLFALWPLLEPVLFANYPALGPLVLGWGVQALLAGQFRCLEALFQALGRFAELATVTFANGLVMLALLTSLVLPLPLHAVLLILSAGQAGVIAILLLRLRPLGRPRMARP